MEVREGVFFLILFLLLPICSHSLFSPFSHCILVIPGQPLSSNIYISQNGTDDASKCYNGSRAQPCRTIAFALGSIPSRERSILSLRLILLDAHYTGIGNINTTISSSSHPPLLSIESELDESVIECTSPSFAFNVTVSGVMGSQVRFYRILKIFV